MPLHGIRPQAADGGTAPAFSGLIAGKDGSGNLQDIITDTSGHLQVDILSGGGGGTEYTEDVATANPIVGTATMMERDDIIATLTPAAGDWAAFRCSAEGALWVQDFNSDAILSDLTAIKTAVEILDNAISGSEMQVDIVSGAGGTEYSEDASTPSTIAGTTTMMERDDVIATLTPIAADWAAMRCSAEGALWTQDFNSDAILADTTAIKTAVETLDNAISGSEMQVDLVSANVTNAGTFAVQVDGSALTALQLLDDTVSTLGTTTYTEATTKGNVIGVVRNDTLAALANTDNEIAPLQVNASGALYIQEGSALDVSGATLTVNAHAVTNAGTFAVQVDGSALTALQLIDNIVSVDDAAFTLGSGSGVMMMGFAGTQSVNANDSAALACDTDGALHIADGGNSITIDGTVTADLGATDNAVLDAIAASLALLDNSISSGNELQVDVVGSLPAGSAAIGKLAANSGVDIGDVDITSIVNDSINGPESSTGPSVDSYTQVAINLTTGANQVLASSASNKQIWVYGYTFTCGDAAGQTVSFQDEDDTALSGIMEFAQYGGAAVSPSGNFAMPIWKLATDKDLEVDITGGDVDGWISIAVVDVS